MLAILFGLENIETNGVMPVDYMLVPHSHGIARHAHMQTLQAITFSKLNISGFLKNAPLDNPAGDTL